MRVELNEQIEMRIDQNGMRNDRNAIRIERNEMMVFLHETSFKT
jgi:hypothetical protein